MKEAMKRVSLEIFMLYFIFLPFLFRQKDNTEMYAEEVGKALVSSIASSRTDFLASQGI